MSFWADTAKLAETGASGRQLPIGPKSTGRMVGALSFESGAMQLKAVVRGADVPAINKSGIRLAELPATTVAGVSVAGAGPAFQKAWPQLQKFVGQLGQSQQFDSFVNAAQQQFGIKVPDDVATLLGTDLTLAVDERGLAESMQGGVSDSSGAPTLPQVGLRSTTDVSKAKALLPKLDEMLAASGAPIKLGKATGSDSMSIATTQAYADELVKGGSLGSGETFKAAVPESDKAQFGLFVDFDKIEKLYPPSLPAQSRANLTPLRAIGLAGSTTADGGTFTMRVLVN
ncbi:MAG TPA: hypothetical protein VKB55_21830, partial [Nocardioidaceae bacterium]|nr:hypothetical protein [Nocardioidaceae bacterium]